MVCLIVSSWLIWAFRCALVTFLLFVVSLVLSLFSFSLSPSLLDPAPSAQTPAQTLLGAYANGASTGGGSYGVSSVIVRIVEVCLLPWFIV